MTAATLSIPSRSMPWRIVLAGVALVLAAILVFSTVDFGSSSSATTTTPPASTQAVGSADSLDRVVSVPAPSAGLTPDAIDRVSAPSADTDLYACHPGKPC